MPSPRSSPPPPRPAHPDSRPPRPACRAVPVYRAVRRTRRTRPCPRGRSVSFRVPRCQGARVPGCQGAKVPGCQGARVPGCQGARVRTIRCMRYVNLGRTGLKVSRLCLGMMTYGDPKWRAWVLPEDQGRRIIRRALEAGISFFGTADMYSLGVSEEVTGRAVRDFARRDDVVIATKVFNPM